MQGRNERRNPRHIASRPELGQWVAMETNAHPEPDRCRENQLPLGASLSSSAKADAALQFGRFRVLLRHRLLLADGAPVELGTRAFDLLLVLLDADGSLVSKKELLSRVWPDVVVSEENLKVQIAALRKDLASHPNSYTEPELLAVPDQDLPGGAPAGNAPPKPGEAAKPGEPPKPQG